MRRTALMAVLVLAACAPSAPDKPVATPTATVKVDIPGPDVPVTAGTLPTPEIDGVAPTAGAWVRDPGRGGDAALFNDRRGATLFAVRCERGQHQLVFVRSASASPGAMMRIVTPTGATSYTAVPRRFAPGAMATVPVGDGFVRTSLARATDRIGIVMTGSDTLVMAADRVIGEVIADCVAAGAAGAANGAAATRAAQSS